MGCRSSRRSRSHGSSRSCDRNSQRQRYPTSQPCERPRGCARRQTKPECCSNTVNLSYQYPQQTQSECFPDISEILSEYSNVSEMPSSNMDCCSTTTRGNRCNRCNASECTCNDVVQRNEDIGCKTVVCLTFHPTRRRRNF